MIDLKKMMGLTKEQQLDIVKSKVEVARRALALAHDKPEDVKDILRQYVKVAEATLEKASWSLR